MDSYDVLVIILSVALLISTIVWILIAVTIFKILKQVKVATDKAQQTAENVQAFTSQFKKLSTATALGSVIKQFTKAFKNKDK